MKSIKFSKKKCHCQC